MKNIAVLLLGIIVLASCKKEVLPAPVEPIPSAKQIAWQEMEYYGFLHFNMNTFTNEEWSYGDTFPIRFNSTQFDAKQWMKVAKEDGNRVS